MIRGLPIRGGWFMCIYGLVEGGGRVRADGMDVGSQLGVDEMDVGSQ